VQGADIPRQRPVHIETFDGPAKKSITTGPRPRRTIVHVRNSQPDVATASPGRPGVITALTASLLLLLGQGWGTMVTHMKPGGGNSPADTGTYRGTHTDLLAAGFLGGTGITTFPASWGLLGGAVVACDIPRSAVADTIVWPYDRTTPPPHGWWHGPE
jgi:uncharacterized protein YceK